MRESKIWEKDNDEYDEKKQKLVVRKTTRYAKNDEGANQVILRRIEVKTAVR